MKSYYDVLPKDYFDNLYTKVAKALIRGENVLVSAMWGCGGKTFLNLFLRLARKEKLFDQIYYFDPEANREKLDRFVKKYVASGKGRTVVTVRFFEKVEDKSVILERLHRMRVARPEELVFLVMTDHTGMIFPEKYSAQTTSFFSERFSILPFDQKQTEKMIRITCKYYGWHIRGEDYERVFRLSGGIPRLVKYVCKGVDERGMKLDNPRLFLTNPSISFELDYLVRISMQLGLDKAKRLGLVDDKGEIKSELLLVYYKNFQVQLITQLYPNLSGLEEKVLNFLLVNQGTVVSFEKMGDLMAMGEDDYSLWAIYKLISRLKHKVEKNFEIKNIKGRGYLLEMR